MQKKTSSVSATCGKRLLNFIAVPFVTKHLCETGFSVVAVMETKYQSLLIIQRNYELPFHQ
jgi:hypothetical protein